MSMVGEDPKHEQTPAGAAPTPRTDAEILSCRRDDSGSSKLYYVEPDFARALEREIDACANREAAAVKEAMRLGRENAALREQLALAEAERDLRPEVHEHTDALFALRQQLAEARRKALERAAQTCDDHARSYGAINPDRTEEQRRFDYRCEYALKNAAQAIRALIDQPAQGKEDK